MRYEVSHETVYTYDRPVFLEPHTVRLRPRGDGAQRLARFDIELDPRPAGAAECLDVDGNSTTRAWFEETTGSLRIVTSFEVETVRVNPFDYLLDPAAAALPMTYDLSAREVLAPYASRPRAHASVTRFARSIAEETGGETLAFLAALNARISETCTMTRREEGDPQMPEIVLSGRPGSCRDLTVLFMDSCRALGIAARFVSGYQEGSDDLDRRDLHAWGEVYLPGAGWRGYDPSLGLVVADRHIAVAAARTSQGAAPVTGAFLGADARATMTASIELRRLEECGE